MKLRAAYTYVAITTAVIGFQLALALGAPWGAYTQGGLNEGSLPTTGRVVALFSTSLLILFACGVLALHGRGPLKDRSPRFLKILRIFTLAYGFLGVLANLASPSEVERALWTPVAVALLISLLLAQPRRR